MLQRAFITETRVTAPRTLTLSESLNLSTAAYLAERDLREFELLRTIEVLRLKLERE